MIEVKGGFDGAVPLPPLPTALLPLINRQFVHEATRGIREKASSGSRYMTMRSGGTARSVFGHLTATGAEVGASGPGVSIQEDGTENLPGGVIRPRKSQWLTFRLYASGDTTERTGPWVRVRQVKIRASHFIRDSVDEALDQLPVFTAVAAREVMW